MVSIGAICYVVGLHLYANSLPSQASWTTEADALKTKEEAARAEAERSRRAAAELRAQLLDQSNRILETRDTPRGLVVNMGEVLFDFGKYDLRSEAREKLANCRGLSWHTQA
jgi:outer membrane protein OmpA-like peptidoglycan-associated protein